MPKPTFFDENKDQTPGVIFGNDVDDIDEIPTGK